MLKLQIEAIKSLLEQGKPVLVNMYGSWNAGGQNKEGLHTVVAYEYSVVDTQTLMKFYDCNNGTKHGFYDHDRTMKFGYDSQGRYGILDDGDKEVNYKWVFLALDPTSSWTTIKDHIGSLLDWLRDKLSELWDAISQFAIDAPQHFAEFLNWLAQNAKDIWAKIIQIKLFSHAQLHVYSSDGRHVGQTLSGNLDQEFDAMFLQSNEMQYFLMPNPQAGTYTIRLVGTSVGDYTLFIESCIEGIMTKNETIENHITEGEVHEYKIFQSTTGEVILDNTPPETDITIGEPLYVDFSNKVYVSTNALFTLGAQDNIGGSGVSSTMYRIFNETDDTGWIAYVSPFTLSSLKDGTYTIAFNSTDNAGNVEPTNTIQVTLFSWTYIFTDSYGRGTTLKINTQHKLFQFIAPNKDFCVKRDAKMIQLKHTIIICYEDRGMRLIATAVDDKINFCSAIVYDKQTCKTYILIDKPNC